MLREAKSLYGATLHATDGEIGSVDEILFDDEHWTVRYLVVNTRNWLLGRKVLISPMACGQPDWERQMLNVNLTLEQIKNSPSVETDNPVSRQWETNYNDYYDYPYYWGGLGMYGDIGMWGGYWYPGALMVQSAGNNERLQRRADEQARDRNDAHLRSTKEVTGYAIQASDGELGHIHDFIIDDESWAIRYLAIDTHNWWPGKKILLPPNWIEQVSWPNRAAVVHLDRSQIRNSPAWYSGVPISRVYEGELHSYYGKQGYWDREQTA